MSDKIIEDDNEIVMVMSVMLRGLLADKMGEERLNSEYTSFSYAVSMDNLNTGSTDTFMVSFDRNNRFRVDQIENNKYPENCLLFFNDDKENAILNAALYGDGFFIDEDSEIDLDDHLSGP